GHVGGQPLFSWTVGASALAALRNVGTSLLAFAGMAELAGNRVAVGRNGGGQGPDGIGFASRPDRPAFYLQRHEHDSRGRRQTGNGHGHDDGTFRSFAIFAPAAPKGKYDQIRVERGRKLSLAGK